MAEPATVADALVLAARRWDEQRYFEAHELLERAWRADSGPDRDLWKGVIQVAVAGVHLQRGNRIGARRLIDRALGRLEPLADIQRDVDVAALRRTARRVREQLDAGQVPPADLGRYPAARSAP
jgi:uncharacterized protein